ncbi:MAG: transposase, partial [bacterium]
MLHSLVQSYLHIVFSTKHRRSHLTDRSYMSGVCKNPGCIAFKIGAVQDHAHLLTRHFRKR